MTPLTPAMSRRKEFFPEVTDQQWNDWHWQVKNRIETVDELKKYIKLTAEEEEGIRESLKTLRMAITPYYLTLIDPENPKLFAISNNFSKNSVYAPVIGMLMSISSRQFTMRNKVPFVYFLDEMTTVNIRNFETMPSVLREYKVGFVLQTQSGSKVENQYGRLDRSSVEANFGNQFFGRTKDVESLKYYPMIFGKEEKERRSRSTGKSGGSTNRSVTVSSQKEDIYQGKDFADLEPGEFIGSATRANVSYFKVKLEMYDDRNEEPLPDVRVLEPGELGRNFARILEEVRELFPCE
mgnify:CR=1 FL=1